jgi:preprotein translocase subunit SecA
MVFSFLKNILDSNIKEIKRLTKKVDIINGFEAEMRGLSDSQLQAKTPEFRERLAEGSTLEEILPEAFAVVREASRRVLGMRHFDVQLIGGMVLHEGNIAEMKTGEGKTLVATLPAYLNALTGQGVHVITVNDYLARRDSEWMGQVHRFLGLSVGLIVHGIDSVERKQAYAADITYGTNNEYGFDYLRDNMVFRPEHMVQRPLNYAIVDEVDSILIDEARTPLIISGQGDKPKALYQEVAAVMPRLKAEQDYTLDEKAKRVTLTEEGAAKVEKLLGVTNLYDSTNMEISHHVNQALHAQTLMKRDVDYVVKNGEIIIVDEFTGRLMFGRRYSEGLHQAIEAKEGVQVEKESQTLASVTFQNYFRMYTKLSGMTGTAMTEEEEFRKIYKLNVVVVPTNQSMIRQDTPDVIYRSEQGKFKAAVDDISLRHASGQPVLVGTISIEKSELLSDMLHEKKIPHQVLNAKFHEHEAAIVAQAGRRGSVTVSTNMAGRGTDILLGGNPEFIVKQKMLEEGFEPEVVELAASQNPLLEETHQEARRHFAELLAQIKPDIEAEHKAVVAAGGLHIIGTERHESRRIDNQLRGRAGRQGDPGSSQFYISLEDDLMRLFGSDNFTGIMDKLGMDDDMPIENSMVSRALENAQRRVEARNFDMRKNVLEYDDVMNEQRKVIYAQRRQVLQGEDIRESVLTMIKDVVNSSVDQFAAAQRYVEDWDITGLMEYAYTHFLPKKSVSADDLLKLEAEEARANLLDKALAEYAEREQSMGSETMRELERLVTLRSVDTKWMEHLDAMDQMRQGIGLRAYGQRDPLIEYKNEAFEMFSAMIAEIEEEIVRYMYFVNVVERPKERQNLVENRSEDVEAGQAKQATTNKVGRNDPCPCGSGKKYKKCCGAEKE